jgi:hypothetical protein
MSNVALVRDPQIEEVRATPRATLVPHEQAATVEYDPHPLLTVLVATAIAAVGALTLVGSIVFWLALRHSGLMAP